MSSKSLIETETIVTFSIDEICELAAVQRQFVILLIEHGVLEPQGSNEENWLFQHEELRVCRRAASLNKDLNINVPGIGLTLQLLKELETLRAQNRQLSS